MYKKMWLILLSVIAFYELVPAQKNPEKGLYYPIKTYTPAPVPTFDSAWPYLPQPVLTQDTGWLTMYRATWEMAIAHYKQPPEGSPLVANFLDEAFAPNIFQWDMIFMIMFARYADAVLPAISSLDNFYSQQHANGYICREIEEATGHDFVYESRAHTVNPPLFSWAEMESFHNTGDTARLARVLPVLEKYVQWLNRPGTVALAAGPHWADYGRKAMHSVHELFWNTGLGSGMDNTPRGGNGWVDMSCQMVIQYNNLASMCHALHLPEKARQFEREAQRISREINHWCWNETDGLYYDVDSAGQQVRWKTAGSFWPLIAGVASPEQACRLVQHLKDTTSFWRPVVFPTLAADQPDYHANGGYWLGGVWAPTNYAIIKGLERYGYYPFARKATRRYLNGLYTVFQHTGTLWENYQPEQAAPGQPAKPDFVGWTGIGPIALLIENELGFHSMGQEQRVVWRIHRTDKHGIRNLQVGQAQVTAVFYPATTRHPPKILAHASQPAELIVYYQGRQYQAELSPSEQPLVLD